MIKAIIFDFDGTLVNLFDQHLTAFQETIKRHFNIDFKREDLDEGYGRNGEDILRMFFKKKGLYVNTEKLKEIAAERRNLALEKIGWRIKLLPGAGELIKNLKKAGLKIAVATSCSRKICDRALAMPQFKELDASTTGSEVMKGKPDPEIFLKTAEKLGVKPEECIIFEDSAYGVKAGKNAGMKVIAVTTGHDSKEKLIKENPDRIIQSLVDVRIEGLKRMN
ncbi:MAG: HAD family phosphatase [Candidatus Altiarchaeota archaeon]